MEEKATEYDQIREVLAREFKGVRKSVLKNLGYFTVGMVLLLRNHRGWYGRFTLSGLARVLTTPGTVKSRYKRLSRFLDNGQVKMAEFSPGLVRLAARETRDNLLPLIVDQTAAGEIQVVTGSYPIRGRSIPVALTTFQYDQIKESQNVIEETFLVRLARCLPKKTKVVWIMDRGYGRCSLLRRCRKQKWFFIIRGRSEVIVEYIAYGKRQRRSLGRLPHRQGKPRRYYDVLYQEKGKEKIDVIVYREKGFKEPWFLLVPAGSETVLSTETVVNWYRARMRIEVTFRDFKSHCGLRGLVLKVRQTHRLERLLVVLVLVYILLLVLGVSAVGQQIRKEMEILRRTGRHGTARTLSILSVAFLVASDSFFLTLTNLLQVLVDCLRRLFQKKVVLCLSG